MKRYQFDELFVQVDRVGGVTDTEAALKRLNALGAEGWEIIERRQSVKMVDGGPREGWLCFVKRELPATVLPPREEAEVASKKGKVVA